MGLVRLLRSSIARVAVLHGLVLAAAMIAVLSGVYIATDRLIETVRQSRQLHIGFFALREPGDEGFPQGRDNLFQVRQEDGTGGEVHDVVTAPGVEAKNKAV